MAVACTTDANASRRAATLADRVVNSARSARAIRNYCAIALSTMTVSIARPAEIDPLGPLTGDVWHGSGVRVRRRIEPHHAHPSSLCTPRFCADRHNGVLTVEHDLTPEELSDTLAVLLTEQLGEILLGQHDFESVFTGIVRSTLAGGLPAWSRFYSNSLSALESGHTAFAPIHCRAAELVRGKQLLDLGSCFGFFPLRMRRLGLDVLATDVSAPTMGLLARVSTVLERPVKTLVCDAARVPLPDGITDTVTSLHLLEHLEPEVGEAVVDEALRLARRRVVIAVPFEDEPQACYGHVRRFDIAALGVLGERHPEVHATVFEHHGGWLVLDRV